MERSIQCNNAITSLKAHKGTVHDIPDILNEQVKFYTNLYKSRHVSQVDIDRYLNTIKLENYLSDAQKSACEGSLSKDECTQVITRMKRNKSPGSDGLPVEFYITFWDHIANMVVNSLNDALHSGTLSCSQKRAIITLIFKKGDRELLKNWRPISLLNTDYKIAAFALANRLHKVLDKIINTDQSGYIKNRFIGGNIRLISDIFEYIDNRNEGGAIIFCDFEKAFDTVEINFLISVLKKFNFGPNFTRWISTFYTNIEASIKSNNWISEPFPVSRGIRQGCPVSALLFIVAAEIMATAIRQNQNIKGIKLPDNNTELKISQLADDTSIFISDKESVNKVLEEVEMFGNMAGPKLNTEKTIGIWLGKWKDNKDEKSSIHWSSDPVKTLGVYFGHDINAVEKLNWENKISKATTCLKKWQSRKLSLTGRILLAKTFGISQFIYIASSSNSSHMYIKAINKLLFNFVWKGKRDKIKRTTMMAERQDGGLNMPDFSIKDKAIKVSMLSKIIQPGNEKWKILPRYYLNMYGPNYLVLTFNFPHPDRLPTELKIPQFYKQLIQAWYCSKKLPSCRPNDSRSIRESLIWGNKWITSKRNKPLWHKKLIDNNILYINDIFDAKGHFQEHKLFTILEGNPKALIDIFVIKNAIPCEWKTTLKQKTMILSVTKQKSLVIWNSYGNKWQTITDITAKDIYHTLVTNYKTLPSTRHLWRTIFTDKNIVWKDVFQQKLIRVKEEKIISFNFKVLHNILATPDKLKKWTISQTDLCHLCFLKGDLKHMMLDCCYFSTFYDYVTKIFGEVGLQNMHIDLYSLVCGYKSHCIEYSSVNLVLNVMFFCVYKCWTIALYEGKHIDPLYLLLKELNIRMKTALYDNSFCKKFSQLTSFHYKEFKKGI